MFSRKKGLIIVTIMALLGIAFVVRVGQAQKPTSAKAPSGGHAQLTSSVAVVGRAVGFAETRPVRELMASASQTDRELQEEAEEIERVEHGVQPQGEPACACPKRRRAAVFFWTGGPFQVEHPKSDPRLRGRGRDEFRAARYGRRGRPERLRANCKRRRSSDL